MKKTRKTTATTVETTRVAPYLSNQNWNYVDRLTKKYDVSKSQVFNDLLNDARKNKWANVSNRK
jgi:hypothetical protein|tara:strand:- start:1 stop:192 length:192 start_codon:yes stop_codon:yes gene_type:complete